MARTKIATAAEVETLASLSQDFALDLHAMCDRLDKSFGDDALRAGMLARYAQQVNAVALAASLLNSKILAIIAMREDEASLRERLQRRLEIEGKEP